MTKPIWAIAAALLLTSGVQAQYIPVPLYSEDFESLFNDGLLEDSVHELGRADSSLGFFTIPQDPVNPGTDGIPGTGDDIQKAEFVWTDTPPAGWSVDDSGVWTAGDTPAKQAIGVEEWEGWSFAAKDFWAGVAGDQRRTGFSLGTNVVAVADNDEWDDREGPDGFAYPGFPDGINRSPATNVGTFDNGTPADTSDDIVLTPVPYYNAFMTTPSIALPGIGANSLLMEFASSWRDESFDDGDSTNNQTGVVEASFDGGLTWLEVHRRDSDPNSPFFKNDTSGYTTALVTDDTNPLFGTYAENELVKLAIANPAGATSVQFRFGTLNSANDWWWAVDNIVVGVPEPSSLALAGLMVGGVAVAARRRK